MGVHFPPVRAPGYPTPAYDPYENRSTTRQVNMRQIKLSLIKFFINQSIEIPCLFFLAIQ